MKSSSKVLKVKSAIRVFEVLEYFEDIQRDASLSDIARHLGYPLSSASMLLQSMVEAGYLSQQNKQYRPTLRVAMLGSWVASATTPDVSILQMMEWIGAQCSQTVVLAVPEPTQVRYIRVVPATSSMRLHVTPGAVRPYPTSGVGRLFMSQMDEDRIHDIVQLYNAHQAKGVTLQAETIRREVQTIRNTGVSVSVDQVSPGEGVVAMALPRQDPQTPLAIGIGGSSQLIREKHHDFRALLEEAFKFFLPASGKRQLLTPTYAQLQ